MYKILKPTLAFVLCSALLSGCNQTTVYEEHSNDMGHTAPTPLTIKANQQILSERPFDNTVDFELARKGLIAREESLSIAHIQGGNVWSTEDYSFIEQNGKHAPDSVNPSLWRQEALNNIHGLFEVADGIYQVRGYDLANMTLIKGQSGWIIVDPLTARETASRAFELAQKHLGEYPVTAILFTHSHIDHFGGVQGILEHLSPDEQNQLQVIAPAGFDEEATSENLIAGTAMSRRAMFMYGKRLNRDERGHIGTGLGKGPAFGSFGILKPNILIEEELSTRTIDGIRFEFLSVSGTEAPAEFVFYLPDMKAFCGAELVSRNLHNLYTLRGAKVRDGHLWSAAIERVRKQFSDARIYFGSHHWPVWGQADIQAFLAQQRDTYKYIHDQGVRRLNEGLTPNEIAEQLTLPTALKQDFHNQGYYGTVKHNARAVYQAYLGWFDANPANLDPLPETDSAQRYIAMMGGIQEVLTQAQTLFTEADRQPIEEGKKTYRWLAELLNKAVFAEPDNHEARALLAQVYDQLGYMAESAPWRDFYLTGAYELRHGGPAQGINPAVMKDVLLKTPVSYFFDSMAVRLKAEEADDIDLSVKITFSDLNESHRLTINRAVMHHQPVDANADSDASLSITQTLFVKMIIGEAGLKETLFGDELKIDGNPLDLIRFFSLFDKPEGTFNIVTP